MSKIKEIQDAIEMWQEEKRQMEFAYRTMHIRKELKEKRLKFYDVAIQALTEKLEREQGWIPVSERLPEEEGYYNVTIKSRYNEASLDIEYCLFELSTKKFFIVADGSDELNQSWKEEAKIVTAWQPLPTPYKEVTK